LLASATHFPIDYFAWMLKIHLYFMRTENNAIIYHLYVWKLLFLRKSKQETVADSSSAGKHKQHGLFWHDITSGIISQGSDTW